MHGHGLDDRGELFASVEAQIGIEVDAFGESSDGRVGSFTSRSDDGGDNVGEELLFAVEVLVHGLLGYLRSSGDVIHAGPGVALGEEDLGCCFGD